MLERKTDSERRDRSPRLLTWIAVGGFVLALVAYAVGAFDSLLLDPRQRAATDLLIRYAAVEKTDERREQALADLYWLRYPDVAGDWYFGKNGKLGLWGAREHFKRHGKREGRNWPTMPK